jgi:hypothetical protein
LRLKSSIFFCVTQSLMWASTPLAMLVCLVSNTLEHHKFYGLGKVRIPFVISKFHKGPVERVSRQSGFPLI